MVYTGKSQSLGIKQGGPAQGKWAELPITKSPKIVQVVTGHEGLHALMVAEDGSVFFVGTSRRGEDGDTSVCKWRIMEAYYPFTYNPGSCISEKSFCSISVLEILVKQLVYMKIVWDVFKWPSIHL